MERVRKFLKKVIFVETTKITYRKEDTDSAADQAVYR